MKKLTFFCVIMFCVISGFSQQEKYSEVNVFIPKEKLIDIARLGIPAEEGFYHKEGYWHSIISETDLYKLANAGFRTEIINEDYAGMIESRNREYLKKYKEFNKIPTDKAGSPIISGYQIPDHFELGSMGGFYTLQEVLNELDSMVHLYPSLITTKAPVSTQTTIEGRTIYFVKISKNPNVSESEPRILYDALTHAREPQGMQQLIFYMWYLLENYETNPEVKYLVDNLEMYFIPVMNPDGYEYNRSSFPIGGGQWRKNRRDNGGGIYGVDLNRNWGFQWGYDDTGSSPFPSDDTYRGNAPFSEPETQIVRDFCNQVQFREALNYHTYSDLFLFPWSYIIKYTTDSAQFMNFSDIMTRENRYSTGVAGELLYTTNGDMNDWAYGEQSSKPKVFSYTPEVGKENDGFWPVPDRIIPLCQENMYQNLMLAHLALKYAETRDIQHTIVSEREGFFKFELVRYGIEAPANYTVSITPLDTAQIIHTGPPQYFMNPVQLQVYTDSIAYTLAPDLNIGTAFSYMIKVSNGVYTFIDTVTKYFGPRLVVFEDSCNQFTKWTSPKWNVTTSNFVSPTGSITDSPTGKYLSNTDVSVTTWNSIDLKDSPVAVINYWGLWDLERGYDYVQVKVSDNGVNYFPKPGRYTKNGSQYEDEGDPVYDGKQLSWVREEIVLTDYVDKDIKVRFTLRSDQSGTADGFYFDDFSVSVIDMSGVGIPDPGLHHVILSPPAPNPASGEISLRYDLPSGTVAEFTLTDSRGKLVREIQLNDPSGLIRFSVEGLQSGIYFCKIRGSFGTSDVRKLVVIR